ncbi:ATP-binding protein, partial [Ktedonospora formicarum]|uniref:ATP-binding protein n=1 Tax=Ktedonospora formicarum TaxID=2778364 RepID=UPI001C68DD70
MILQGEAGIGKTRLAEELSLEAYTRGWAVAWNRSFEQEITIPYRPWSELIRTLLQSVHELTPIYTEKPSYGTNDSEPERPIKLSFRLDQLGVLLPELVQLASGNSQAPSAISLEQERLHLWEATLNLLDALSQVTPLLLVFDDLHWADESSLDLLTYLIHHFRQQRILVVATCRDGELPPHHKIRTMSADLRREQALLTIPIAPLSLDQIGSLVAHLPQDMVQNIQEQAAGNPFFAEELARFMAVPEARGTHLRRYDTHAENPYARQRSPRTETVHPALPEAISAVLERRLHRMSTSCRALLNKAAVLGGSFELSQLLPMVNEQNEDTILDLLDEALEAGLLTEEGTGAHITYHFWHPLI